LAAGGRIASQVLHCLVSTPDGDIILHFGQPYVSIAITAPQCAQYLFASSANSTFPSPLFGPTDAFTVAVPLTDPDVMVAFTALDLAGISSYWNKKLKLFMILCLHLYFFNWTSFGNPNYLKTTMIRAWSDCLEIRVRRWCKMK